MGVITPKNEKAPAHAEALAVWTRLELATPCVTGRYSNQLNYQTVAYCGCKYRVLFVICKENMCFFSSFFFV